MSETIVVRGAHADAYRAYRDVRSDIDQALIGTYRETLLRVPRRADAQTLAIVLNSQVRFAPAARDLFARALGDEEGAEVPFPELRPHLRASDGARELIAACEGAGATGQLATALTFLLIEANLKTVEIEEPGELPTEDEGDDGSGSLPDEPPDDGGES